MRHGENGEGEGRCEAGGHRLHCLSREVWGEVVAACACMCSVRGWGGGVGCGVREVRVRWARGGGVCSVAAGVQKEERGRGPHVV